MKTKLLTNSTCGHNIQVESPATIHDWIEALGEDKCCEFLFRFRCYTTLNTAIRHRLGWKPGNHHDYTFEQVQAAANDVNKTLYSV